MQTLCSIVDVAVNISETSMYLHHAMASCCWSRTHAHSANGNEVSAVSTSSLKHYSDVLQSSRMKNVSVAYLQNAILASRLRWPPEISRPSASQLPTSRSS